MFLKKLKSVPLPVPVIIWGTQKHWAAPGYAHAPFSPKFLTGFFSDWPCKCHFFMRDRKYENWFLSHQTNNEAGATGATLAAFRLHTFHGSLLPSFRPIHLFPPPLIPSSLPFLLPPLHAGASTVHPPNTNMTHTKPQPPPFPPFFTSPSLRSKTP